jgi:hypothetical protein
LDSQFLDLRPGSNNQLSKIRQIQSFVSRAKLLELPMYITVTIVMFVLMGMIIIAPGSGSASAKITLKTFIFSWLLLSELLS